MQADSIIGNNNKLFTYVFRLIAKKIGESMIEILFEIKYYHCCLLCFI